jgi:hypothetical protein
LSGFPRFRKKRDTAMNAVDPHTNEYRYDEEPKTRLVMAKFIKIKRRSGSSNPNSLFLLSKLLGTDDVISPFSSIDES